VKIRWGVASALLIGLGSVSFSGAARAEVEGGPRPATVSPQLEPWSRFELGLRTGYGIPIGRATGDATTELNQLIAGQIPLVVDVGARINGHVTFGLYYSYGFGLVGSYLSETCDLLEASMTGATVDVSCYVRSHRVGLQIGYHFTPSRDLDPWIAAGIGHEFLDFTLSSVSGSGSATSTIDADGMEFMNVQSGLDVRLGKHFRIGPFLGLTMTTYGSFTRSCRGACGFEGSSGGDVRNGATHAWLFVGLRGVTLL
jgi:hypothetical protein